MSDLPAAHHQFPMCGACHGDTWHDDGDYRCDDCGLSFDSDTLEAHFTDETAAVCGAPCDNTWHRRRRDPAGRVIDVDCGTCQLPDGHPSRFHWTGCTQRYERTTGE